MINMDIKMNANEKAIILEAIWENDSRPVAFRAITIVEDQDTGARSVDDIAEADSIDVLRDHVKNHMCPTHYMSPRVQKADHAAKSDDAWGDALRVLKTKLHELATDEGMNISRSSSPNNTCIALREHRADVMAQELRRIADDEEKAARVADKEMRSNERDDFSAWAKLVRDNLTHTDDDYMLAVAMRKAHESVEAFPTLLADHVKKLTDNPLYAVSWSGDFIQAAATNEVAQYLVDMFENGVSAQDMRSEAESAMFSKADRAMSRSTSVMSNAADDCLRVAWLEAVKRLSGRSYW